MLSLSTPALALAEPQVPSGGASVFVDDVRVAKGEKAKAHVKITYDGETGKVAYLNFKIPSGTTGISEQDPITATVSNASAYPSSTAYQTFVKTGSGLVMLTSGTAKELGVDIEVPKLTATTKIGLTPSKFSYRNTGDSQNTKIDDSNITSVVGSFIVQYPVTVEIAADSERPANFAIKTKTTGYNPPKVTYDQAGLTETDLTQGGTFYVDSGEGQQNKPVLNFTVPENYYAEVTVNGVKHTVGSSEFTLPEAVTKDTTVSVKLVAGQVPSDEYTNTSMSYRYGNYDLAAQDTKRFDKKGTDNTVAIKNFDGYKLVKYQINNDAAVTENLGTSVTVDNTKDNSIVFTYERKDNSTVVPGPDGAIGGGDDVTITPVDKTQPTITPDETGAVTLPADKQGVVSDDKGNTVVVPGGTKIDKDGKIYLPGVTTPITPENPKPEGSAFYLVTYKYENDVLFTQLGKTGEDIKVMDYPASAGTPEGKVFKNWNTRNDGKGNTYEKEVNINGGLTLYAQWKDATVDPGTLNSAKITYYSDESTSAQTKEEVRSDKVESDFPGALDANAFTAPGEGWTLVGWLRKDDDSNKIYGANENVTLNKGDAWTLYAQWVKNSEDGSITVPGRDGIPGSPDDATAKPGNQGGSLNRDDKTGVITVPPGGSVTVEGKEYPMPDGGTLKPNGEISINQPNNGGSIVVKPDGSTEVVKPGGGTDPDKTAFKVTYESGEAGQPAKVVTAVDSVQIADGEAMFPNFKGHKFAYWKSGDEIKSEGDTLTAETTLTAYWYTVDENGSVVIKPDPDKEPDKEIVVKPDPNGNKPEPGKDGSVEVKPGGSIEVKPKEPNGGVIELPDGGKVNPDGTITIPGVEGKIDPNNPETWPEGILMVKYNANGGKGEMPSQLGKNSITVKKNTFTREGFKFNIWNTEAKGSGTSYKEDATVTYVQKGQVTTLYALWYKQNTDGSIVHPGGDGKFQPDGAKDDITVKPGPGGNVEKPDDKGNIKVPGGGSIVVPGKDGETTEIVPPTGTVITPDGKIESPDPTKPDGSGSVTIDPNKPGELPNGYFYVTYTAGEGTGTDRKQIAKTGDKALDGTNFTAPANRFFAGWKDEDENKGINPGDSLTLTKDIVLVAQWRGNGAENPDLPYSATVKYYRSASDTNPTVEPYKSNSNPMHFQIKNGDILQDTSWSSVADDWTLKGWSNKSGDKFYALGSSLQMNDGDTFEMYAVWTKADGDNVVVPGPDGKPGGGDDITIKPNPDDSTKKPEVQPDGSVKVPDGGEIIIPGANSPTDDKTVTVKPGATVKPDGSIVLPDGGTATIKPDGTTITGPGTIDPGKLPTPNPNPDKPYEPGNGTIVLPGKDGQVDTKDDVIIKPATGEIDKNTGNVTTKGDNTEVKYPSAPDGNGATVKVPEGTVIKPDGTIDNIPNPGGTIILPDGSEITVPGGSKVDPDGTITIPDGGKGEIKHPDGNKSEIPGGSKVDKDGNIILPDGGTMRPDGSFKYTVVLKSTSGATLTANGFNATIWVKKDAELPIVAPAVSGYLITGSSSVTVIGGQKVNGGYTITFTYTQNSGGTVIVTPSNPSKPSNPNKPSDPGDTNRPASPSVTGVSKMLESENHIAYMGGYGNGMFGPNDQMTRAQVAQMFYNLLKDKNIVITVNFSDVQSSDWYATAVNTLASLGIIRGVGDGIFDPNRSITRAEFATIALRFADKTADSTNPFTDVASNDWYYSAVLNAVGFGWITGYSDGTFRPNASITRAEVATIVNRMLDRNADHDFVNGNATASFVDVPSNHWAYYNIMEATTPHTHTVDRNGNESWGKLQ